MTLQDGIWSWSGSYQLLKKTFNTDVLATAAYDLQVLAINFCWQEAWKANQTSGTWLFRFTRKNDHVISLPGRHFLSIIQTESSSKWASKQMCLVWAKNGEKWGGAVLTFHIPMQIPMQFSFPPHAFANNEMIWRLWCYLTMFSWHLLTKKFRVQCST